METITANYPTNIQNIITLHGPGMIDVINEGKTDKQKGNKPNDEINTHSAFGICYAYGYNLPTAPKTRKPRARKAAAQPESILNSFFVGEIKPVYRSLIPIENMPKISGSRDVMTYAREIWEPNTIEIFECFYIFFLNRANRVCGWQQISKGGVAGTVADPKIIFNGAVGCLASGIILAHNHPSGNLTPSHADIELTKKLKSAGQFLEIQVMDHLILTQSNYMSFADEGIL